MSIVYGNGEIEWKFCFGSMDMSMLLCGEAEKAFYEHLLTRCYKKREEYYYPASPNNVEYALNYLTDNRETLVHGLMSEQKLPIPSGDIDFYVDKIDIDEGNVRNVHLNYYFKPLFDRDLIKENLTDFNENTHGFVTNIVEQLKALEKERIINFRPRDHDYKVKDIRPVEGGYRLYLVRHYFLQTHHGNKVAHMLATYPKKHHVRDIVVRHDTVAFDIHGHIEIRV